MKTMKFLAIATVIVGALAIVMPASATSWFGGSAKIVGGAMVQDKSSGQSYENQQPMTIVNAGGWGSLPKESYLTAADMETLAGYLKMQQAQVKALQDQTNADRKALNERAAMKRTIDQANRATSVRNATQPAPAAQKSSGNMVIPKAPVREWEAINKANQAPATKPQ
jgi:hypothetical protein